MIHLYYGNGKGKTTAAMGLALRCAGSGGRVLIFQFLKDNSSSERNALCNIDGIEIINGKSCEKFVFNMSESEKAQASQYYCTMLDEVFENAKEYDMLILDEVMTAVTCGLIEESCLIKQLKKHKDDAEIVMTGGTPSEKVIQICDYVTHMQKIKHPFDNGTVARKGVEY